MRNEATVPGCTKEILQTGFRDNRPSDIIAAAYRTIIPCLAADIATARAYILGHIKVIYIKNMFHIINRQNQIRLSVSLGLFFNDTDDSFIEQVKSLYIY